MTEIKTGDTKDRITPEAFSPAPILMNLPLARPWRRALAMLCDLVVIALLTELEDVGLILFLVSLWLVYKSGALSYFDRFGSAGRWLLRGISLLVVVLALSFTFINISDPEGAPRQIQQGQPPNVEDVLALGVAVYQVGQCVEVPCYQDKLIDYLDFSAKTAELPTPTELNQFIDDMAEDKSMSSREIDDLQQWAFGELTQRVDNNIVLSSADAPAMIVKEPVLETVQESDSFSPLKWIMGFVDDLGLGFGFAAIYFSCFTAWFNGQTFGKMLLNIRVIQLNDSKITLWESFGRYGGYGAGLATGLLGFLQIYWDPNRQGIQDKISATVVIDLGLKQQETTENQTISIVKASEVKK